MSTLARMREYEEALRGDAAEWRANNLGSRFDWMLRTIGDTCCDETHTGGINNLNLMSRAIWLAEN